MSTSSYEDPFSLLPPDVARGIRISESLNTVSDAMWLGDFANSLYDEYIMLFKHKRGFPDLVYVVARLSCLGYVISDLLFELNLATPLASVNLEINCESVFAALDWLGSLTVCITSLLFFFRIRAVFFDFPVIIGGFFLLWLTTCSSFVALFFIRATTLGSNLCLISEVSIWSSIPYLVVAVHDTLVFLAISIRLTHFSHMGFDTDGRSRWKTFFRGSSMPSLSRALLKNGQLYYLVTIGFSVAFGVGIMISSIPLSYRSTFTGVNIIIQNTMACRVYRQLKIGRLDEVDVTYETSEQGSNGRRIRLVGVSAIRSLRFEGNPDLHTTMGTIETAEIHLDDIQMRAEGDTITGGISAELDSASESKEPHSLTTDSHVDLNMDDHCDPFYQVSSTTFLCVYKANYFTAYTCLTQMAVANLSFLFDDPGLISRSELSESLSRFTNGIYLGDFVNSLNEEYVMWRKYRTGFPDFVYFAARLSCLGYALSSLILVDFPVDCRPLNLALTWTASFSVCITSLLFFFRIRAVFYGSPKIIAGFFLLWLGTFTAFVGPFVVHSTTIGPRCAINEISLIDSIPFIVVAVHDTLVFFAISIQLTLVDWATGKHRSLWKAFLAGVNFRGSEAMPNISGALLVTGQLYYLVTIGVSVATAIGVMLPSIPLTFRAFFTSMNIFTQNAMACRVYRQLKIGLLHEVSATRASDGSNFGEGSRVGGNGAPSSGPLIFWRNLTAKSSEISHLQHSMQSEASTSTNDSREVAIPECTPKTASIQR
ncbi:hypothetical protein C8Q75DRAFT_806709 [Abortiporus biennis]|nr:hypothetical protein C8Q75DRAFT_806709 [Abortiporus biennis]